MNYKTKTVRQSCTSENEMNYKKLQEAILICKMKDKKPFYFKQIFQFQRDAKNMANYEGSNP